MISNPGPWVAAHLRVKEYFLAPFLDLGAFRFQTSLDGGKNQLTLYVFTVFGFSLAVHFPKQITDWILRRETHV